MNTAEKVPTWPRIEAAAREDGSGEVVINGTTQQVTAANLDEIRVAIITRVTETAIKMGRPVRVSTTGPDGDWPLIVHPDGSVEADEEEMASRRKGSKGRSANSASGRSARSAPSARSADSAAVQETAAAEEPTPSAVPTMEPSQNLDPSQNPDPSQHAAPVQDAGPESLADPVGEEPVHPTEPSGPPASPATPVVPRRNDTVPYVPTEARWEADPGQPPLNGTGPINGAAPANGVPHDEAAQPVEPFVHSMPEPQFPEHSMPEPPNPQSHLAEPGTAMQPMPYPTDPEPPQPEPDTWTDAEFVPGFGADPNEPADQPPAQQPIRVDQHQQPGQPIGPMQQHPGQPPIPPDPVAEPAAPEARQSFLNQETSEEPARRGFRGFLGRVGIRVGPNAGERSERDDLAAVSQHWPGPRTIAIVNGKGGASKTPTSCLLSAVFARFGGGGVVAWDNNQTRGTLGWRTEQGPHDATLLDLLPQVHTMTSVEARSADMARFVHHQGHDRYDVLRSKPMALAHEQRVESADVDAIETVLDKYYRIILVDSGNDESDPTWLRMIDLSDQIVVATTPRDDHAEAGALLLEALGMRDEHSAHLARNAVVVVNQANPDTKTAELNRVANGYGPLARETVAIPFDPAMVDGLLRYDALRPVTQRAWLAAGAAVARGL